MADVFVTLDGEDRRRAVELVRARVAGATEPSALMLDLVNRAGDPHALGELACLVEALGGLAHALALTVKHLCAELNFDGVEVLDEVLDGFDSGEYLEHEPLHVAPSDEAS